MISSDPTTSQPRRGSDIVILTAGLPRKPGMSRDDLLSANAEIVGKAAVETLKHSPDAIYIVLTNPLDTMAYLTMKLTGLPRSRVIGQAGVLDSARMRAFVAKETGISVENVSCYVLGGHGDEMVPLTRHSNVAGIPFNEYLAADRLEAIVNRTRKGGGEIVNLLKTGSAYLCPLCGGRADDRGHPQGSQPCHSVLRVHARGIRPQGHLLRGASGPEPAGHGRAIMEYKLSPEEQALFDKSAAAVKETHEALKKLVKI